MGLHNFSMEERQNFEWCPVIIHMKARWLADYKREVWLWCSMVT